MPSWWGLGSIASIADTGTSSPGLVMEETTETFREQFFRTDMIISKGQGNYEALSQQKGPIFFLLITKCRVIAEETGSSMRDILLIEQQ